MFGFPLLLIPLAICNIVVFLLSDVTFDVQLFELGLRSADVWKVQLGDALIALALLLLMLELVRSARVGGKFVTDHLLALVIFCGAAAEFMLLPKFGNSTFFLLTLIALVDFLCGIALHARRPRRLRETIVEPEPIPVRDHEPVIAREPPPPPPAPISGSLAAEQAPLRAPERIVPLGEPARVEPVIEIRPAEGEELPPRASDDSSIKVR